MSHLHITALYAGCSGMILVFLALRVASKRFKLKIPLGDQGNRDILKAMRIHGNFIENVPIALVLLALVEGLGAQATLVHGLGIALTVGRLLHAQGLSATIGTSPGRFFGALLTWLMILVASAISLYLGWNAMIVV